MPGGDNIKAFTRIMHRTTDDDLVGEVRPPEERAPRRKTAGATLGARHFCSPIGAWCSKYVPLSRSKHAHAHVHLQLLGMRHCGQPSGSVTAHVICLCLWHSPVAMGLKVATASSTSTGGTAIGAGCSYVCGMLTVLCYVCSSPRSVRTRCSLSVTPGVSSL